MAGQFTINQDQRAFVEAVRRVAVESVAPRAAEIDRTGEYPFDIKDIFAELGFLGASIPEEYGGINQGVLTFCLVIEELSKACVASAMIVGTQDLSSTPIKLGGNEDQKKKYLPGMATGELLGSFCLTEPGAGSDAGALKTKAVLDGEEYILNGTKCFVTGGAVADLFIVFAKTDKSSGTKGISAFIVEKTTPGVKVGKKEDKMGIRGSLTNEILFEDCRIPKENILGEEGDGFQIAMMTLDRTRPSVAAMGLGVAQGALDFTVAYMQERNQFGKPLSSFQGLRWMGAELDVEIEAARSLVYRAAARADSEIARGEKRLSKESVKLSSMAKLKATDVAMRVTTDCVQLAGGYGYIKEFPLERMMRDAKITQIYEGTNQIQREVIAKTLFA